MILTFQELCHPCTLVTPDQKDKFEQWMVSYIDDNKLFMNFDAKTSIQRIYSEIKKGVITWRDILRITGGELELDKTWIGILAFNYATFSAKYMRQHGVYRAGMPELINAKEHPTNITIEENLVDVTFNELEPDQGHVLLGVRLSLSGSFADEFTFRKQQVQDFANKLKATAFDTRDAWMIYQARYKPKVKYCLPITTFTYDQCCAIERPFITAFLNKLGLNRHTKHAVIW